MKKSKGDKRPYLKPVTRFELSEKNIKQRVILLVAAACAALALLIAVVFVVIRMSAGGRSKGRH